MSFITLLESNLYAPITSIILLIFVGGSIVIYGKNIILGLITTFMISAGIFVFFYLMEWEYSMALKVMMLFFAIMSISIFLIKKQSDSGAGVY